MEKHLKKHLSKSDLVELLTISYDIVKCEQRKVFKQLIEHGKKLFFFELFNCSYANMFESVYAHNPSIHVLNINYPIEYLDIYIKKNLVIHKTKVIFLSGCDRICHSHHV